MKGFWRLPRYWKVRVEFVPADFWVGVFYRSEHPGHVSCEHEAWVVLVPMFPIHITYWHKGPAAAWLH